MDLVAVANQMSQIDFQTKLGCAVMSQAKDMIEQQGEALTELINAVPVQAGLGENIDIKL